MSTSAAGSSEPGTSWSSTSGSTAGRLNAEAEPTEPATVRPAVIT